MALKGAGWRRRTSLVQIQKIKEDATKEKESERRKFLDRISKIPEEFLGGEKIIKDAHLPVEEHDKEEAKGKEMGKDEEIKDGTAGDVGDEDDDSFVDASEDGSIPDEDEKVEDLKDDGGGGGADAEKKSNSNNNADAEENDGEEMAPVSKEEDEKQKVEDAERDPRRLDKNDDMVDSKPILYSGRGAGYCHKNILKHPRPNLPFVPKYGRYHVVFPDFYIMPWKQDMKNRSHILQNVKLTGEKNVPNTKHNDFLFLNGREQLHPNVEPENRVQQKQVIPPVDEILRPPFHSHLIMKKAEQERAIFPVRPSINFHHPRLKHSADCYSCSPEYDE